MAQPAPPTAQPAPPTHTEQREARRQARAAARDERNADVSTVEQHVSFDKNSLKLKTANNGASARTPHSHFPWDDFDVSLSDGLVLEQTAVLFRSDAARSALEQLRTAALESLATLEDHPKDDA